MGDDCPSRRPRQPGCVVPRGGLEPISISPRAQAADARKGLSELAGRYLPGPEPVHVLEPQPAEAATDAEAAVESAPREEALLPSELPSDEETPIARLDG